MMDVGALPHGRVTVDSAPIIYFLEDHPRFASRYAPFFQRAEAGDYQLVIATVTLAEVLTGPLRTGDEALAQHYRRTLTTPPTWRLADLTASVALGAADRQGQSRLTLAKTP